MDPIYSKGPAWERHLLRLCTALFITVTAGLCGAALWAANQPTQNRIAPVQPKQQVRLNIPQPAPAAPPHTETTHTETTQTEAIAPAAIAPPASETTTSDDVMESAAAPQQDKPIVPAKPEKPVIPAAAPHVLHLIVTDKQAQIDELVLLPKGLTLVTSATNARLTDYVTFARHLGHSVLLAFPVTEEDTHPLLMSPALTDQENLARLTRLLDDQILIDGVKLYWHNPLAGRTDLMRQALALISDRGLRVVGSNGPLADRETAWVDTIARADEIAETISGIAQPAYGARDTAQTITYATALGPNGHDLLADWVVTAAKNGWTLAPLKKTSQHD